MSAMGQKRTYPKCRGMSALPSKADIQAVSRDVRYVPEAVAKVENGFGAGGSAALRVRAQRVGWFSRRNSMHSFERHSTTKRQLRLGGRDLIFLHKAWASSLLASGPA